MSDKQKQRPSHRISFSAFERGQDGKGKLGNAREIGAIWPREGREGEGILRFDHTPQEKGGYFVRELEKLRAERRDSGRGADRPRGRSPENGRER